MAFAKRHPIITYFVLAYVLGWIFSIPNIMDQLRLLPFSLPPYLGTILFVFAPATSALIVTGISEGKAGMRTLLRRIVVWRVNPWWYVVALGLPIIIQVLAQTAFVPFGGPAPRLDTSVLPSLILFPIPVFEEIGWRGFALPRLQSRFNALTSAVLLGVLWGLWHLPPTVPEFLQGTTTIQSFLIGVVPVVGLSVIMAWIFNNTKGSVLLTTLFHASHNARGHLFPTTWQYSSFGPTQLYEVVMIAIAVLIALLTRPQNLSRKETRVQVTLPSREEDATLSGQA